MNKDKAFAINHELKKHGFASLGEAGPLMAQLAFCVRDEAHFKALLNACEPEDRRDMYEALRPNLRFALKPLDVYIAEMAIDAARRQLPTIGPDGGLVAYREPPPLVLDSEIDDALATDAVANSIAKQFLHVVCVVCTREDTFSGPTKEDAIDAVREAGWRMGFKRVSLDSPERVQVEVCPKCVAQRAPRKRVIA